MERGERLEEWVEGEVMEERGVRVKKMSYLGSEGWGYGRGLMVGLIGEYERGEMKVEGDEVSWGGLYWKEEVGK